eukprot:1423374-Pyramimonas_sp.AAC.1
MAAPPDFGTSLTNFMAASQGAPTRGQMPKFACRLIHAHPSHALWPCTGAPPRAQTSGLAWLPAPKVTPAKGHSYV